MMQGFDAALGMFREEGKPVDYRRLRFLRWLTVQGRLEHSPVGPPSGPFAERLAEHGLPVEPRAATADRPVSSRRR